MWRDLGRGGEPPPSCCRLVRAAGQGFIVEAVQPAVTAHDWECAAGLLDADGRLLMVRGQMHMSHRWLTVLPEMLVHVRPHVLHAAGLICLNQLQDTEARMQAAEEALAANRLADQSRAILGYVTILRAAMLGIVAFASICGELDVTSRTQVLVRARELSLL